MTTFKIASLGLLLLAPLSVQPPASARQASDDATLDALSERFASACEWAEDEQVQARLGSVAAERVAADLERAGLALDAGDWRACLRPFRRAHGELAMARHLLASAQVQSLEELAAGLDALRLELEASGSPLERASERPAVLQAALEDAFGRALGYLSSAIEQGREASLDAGRYYGSSARAQAELAMFLLTLPCAPPARPLGGIPGLEAYFEQLEAELLELYQPPLSQERHATFIGLSASLKFARELRDHGFRAAALVEALQVGLGLARFDEAATRGDAEEAAAAKKRRLAALDDWSMKLAELDADASLPRAWLAEARAGLEADPAPLPAVTALLERGLVDYLACIEDTPTATPQAEPTVTVTLVRWPFT